MTTVNESLHEVRFVRNLLIPLSAGVNLAADLHLPDTPGPHPTLISFYPYRKDDVIGSFTAYPRRWFAERGYAHLLVDVRGYGGSEGRRAESFDPGPEASDAGEVVEWAAAQQWSDGAVGVWGVSYGGLMALAAGIALSPHLRAIAPIYPLFDVAADITLPGGCPAMLGQHHWSTMMLAQGLAPPTYRDSEGRWVRVWRQRLERIEQDGPEAPFWQAHPRADEDYWRGRVLPVERIEVPTLLVGGWRDLFPESVTRAYQQITSPQKRLLIGPWLHVPPDLAAREPVDWLPMLLRFFDQHVRGARADDDPPVLAFVQGGGGWRGATTWPPPRIEDWVLRPGPAGRLGEQTGNGADEYAATPLVGSAGGQWDTQGTGMGYPLEQTPDDLLSLTYTTEPLGEPIELAGSPRALLAIDRLDGDEPFDLVAKLVDVAPDGRAELITTGWARGSSGETSVSLWATAWQLAPGHRLRLSISCADFPRVWPDPTAPRLRVKRAECTLHVPVSPDRLGQPVQPPRPTPAPRSERFPWTIEGAPSWTIEHDLANDGIAVTLGAGEKIRLPEGGTLTLSQQATARVRAAHPESASVEAAVTIQIAYPCGECVEVEAQSRSGRSTNVSEARVTLDGRVLLHRSWRNF